MNDPIPGKRSSRRGSPFQTERRSRRTDHVVDPDGIRLFSPERSGRRGIGRALWALVCEVAYAVAGVVNAIPGLAGRMRSRSTRTAVGLGILAAVTLTGLGLAGGGIGRRPMPVSALVDVMGSSGPRNELGVIIEGTQVRARFGKDIQSLAVAREDRVKADVINTREILLKGLEVGTTSLNIGFDDDTDEVFRLSVQPDLSLLNDTLKTIDPSLHAQSVPDRAAIILEGVVEDYSAWDAADGMARSYLNADDEGRVETRTFHADGALASVTVSGGSGELINNVKLLEAPASLQDKIVEALESIGADEVEVRRIARGMQDDDKQDILVLEGRVADQVMLIRTLTLASRIFVGDDLQEDDIRVLGDESGGYALRFNNGSNTSNNGIGGLLNANSGRSNVSLESRINSNIGRASALELAGGRILSFLEVEDLPQVRVDIRIVEINRRRLLDYNSNFAAGWTEDAPGLQAPAFVGTPSSSTTVQDRLTGAITTTNDPGFGVTGAGDVQEVFGFLEGGFTNKFQLSGNDWAIDTALSLLESEGIAKSLASPSLTVLSGEEAVFVVGGEVPVSETATASGGDTVFQGVEFVNFGVTLAIRPRTAEDGTTVLTVEPQVKLPDPGLTTDIRRSSGAALTSTAFSTRSIHTTARLQDGQSLLIGGLSERFRSDDSSQTPFVHKIPLFGALFKSFTYSDQDREVVFVVTPVVMREPIADAGLWAYPDVSETLRAHLPRWEDEDDVGEHHAREEDSEDQVEEGL